MAATVAKLKTKSEKRHSESLWHTAFRRVRQDRLTLTALAVLVILSVLALLAPVFEQVLGVSYTLPDSDKRFFTAGDNPIHLLGTDHLGRDMLTRLLYGGRISLMIGFLTGLLCTLIGVSIGLVAGFYQGGKLGFVDDFIMWFITTLNSIPTLILYILIASVASPTIPTLIFVLTITSWTPIMRLVRGETLALREKEYILSAKSIGASSPRIMFTHILPNTLSILITTLMLQIGTLILVEAALSFLGLGVRPPEPSWGNMLTDAQNYFRQGPHLSILPGLLIVITVLSLYLLGDGLRDALDPQLEQ